MTTGRSVLVLAALIGLGPANASSAQKIEMRGGEPVLVLPQAMTREIERFDPEFSPRRLEDYPPSMWRQPCRPMPDCARSLYRFDAREAPFAVIGDFNGDRILDAVIDGDNRTTGRRIVVLSGPRGFQASEIDRLERIPASVEASRDTQVNVRGGDEYGVQQGLSRVPPGKYESGYEPEPLVLKVDAFEVAFYERASLIRYYRDGRWHSYVTSD